MPIRASWTGITGEYGTDAAVAQGETISLQTPPQQPILNHLHLWVRRMVQEDPEHADLRMQTLLEEYIRLYPQAVILCDEIGCGVVPMQPQERQWRELTGRLCCQLAQRAQRVCRIFCGLPHLLKDTAKGE